MSITHWNAGRCNRERDRARAELDDADTILRRAVRDADAVGVSQVELAELTGWHRNTIRRIVSDR